MAPITHEKLQTISPPIGGISTPSTISSMKNGAFAASLTSYTPSTLSGDRTWSGKSSVVSPVIEPRAQRIRSMSSGRKHGRSYSSSSMSSATMAFPALDGVDDGVVAPLPTAHTGFSKTRSGSLTNAPKVKIKPFLKKTPSSEKGSLDLARSQAENEGLGIYTSSNNMRREVSGGGSLGGHTRTSSAVSQISTTTASSVHRSCSHYVHPMRQTPHTYTPPLAHSYQNSSANSDDGEDSASFATMNSQQYAPMAGSRRPKIRTQMSNTRLPYSSSQTNINQPTTSSSLRNQDTASPDTVLATARSSLESAIRMRSRSNTAGTAEGDEQLVARLRAEWEAKEAAKEQKYAAIEKRAAEKEAKKQERRVEDRRRKDEQAQRKRTRSNATSEKSMPISSVEYSSTAALPVDEELEYIRRGEMPPQHVRSYQPGTPKQRRGSKAGRAMNSSWDRFWFAFKTMWLKLKRGIGIGERG